MKKTSLNKMVFLTCLDYRTRVLFTKEETVTNCKEKNGSLAIISLSEPSVFICNNCP